MLYFVDLKYIFFTGDKKIKLINVFSSIVHDLIYNDL